MRQDESLKLRPRFNALIPGGCHTYAKGDDQWPEFLAPYLVRGQGSHVWDVDGNEYIEYGPGLRSGTPTRRSCARPATRCNSATTTSGPPSSSWRPRKSCCPSFPAPRW